MTERGEVRGGALFLPEYYLSFFSLTAGRAAHRLLGGARSLSGNE